MNERIPIVRLLISLSLSLSCASPNCKSLFFSSSLFHFLFLSLILSLPPLSLSLITFSSFLAIFFKMKNNLCYEDGHVSLITLHYISWEFLQIRARLNVSDENEEKLSPIHFAESFFQSLKKEWRLFVKKMSFYNFLSFREFKQKFHSIMIV